MVKLVGFVLSPSEHPIYLLKNLVGRFSPLYYIVRTQAKIADVVTNKLVMSTSKSFENLLRYPLPMLCHRPKVFHNRFDLLSNQDH